ncbi:MAG TPA: hypothetical protein DCQ26_04425 [Marinilabiliales bacterium]|nr:MAG: hypothetical protein A2W95_03020 [Bacteroidetes bacterium GWA2_40_14]OFX64955.1 MAG: hypothetical protein A2W84_16145 [Bacteroidetes bacterium GWC2_40_13]OFX72675.1 MAG: hypothetical protein A2W96_18205 [Bacteroidetes bacterium GWD2_40_43]OFX91305.1 MAG: hypothetical protein A2W97_03625 [Bacteroidetes bacterium GWE2_40_63]OFY19375.1 MAG: hypothetical protein A2W88_01505 [Bacteroidetes bacterium GWF2_40_13]OFZ26027.1 MAG: hypothetical protein A2437_10625 [Bacteroidetes bacterium RIFOXYC
MKNLISIIFILFFSLNAFTQMKVAPSGNVAIGTINNPINNGIKLQVVGGVSVFTSTIAVPTSAAFIRGSNIYSTVLTPDYTWWGNDQTGIFHPSPNVIGFSIGGIERMRLASTGQVAINGLISGNNFTFTVNGSAYCSSVWTPSDNRYKSN